METSFEVKNPVSQPMMQNRGPVFLSYRACDLHFLEQVKEFLEIAGVPEIQFDSRPKMLVRTLESLQTLWALLETKQLSQDSCVSFASVKDDSNYLLENYKDIDKFRLRLDFFWILERLAKLCLLAATDPDIRLKDSDKIKIQYPEAASTWLFESQKLDMLPLDLPDRTEGKHFFHWGHKYSTQGLRRWMVWSPEKINKIAALQPSSLHVPWDKFLLGFKSWLQPESIPPLEFSLRVDQEDSYEKLQEDFKDLVVSLRQITQQSLDQKNALVLWFEDPRLEDRMALTPEELNPPEEEET